ncbi:MAG: DEAD/DEAH box helicase [Geminicoccaceae bacterium]
MANLYIEKQHADLHLLKLDPIPSNWIPMKFSELALRGEILKAVEEAGYQEPTPIQEQAIPAILTGGDVLGIAQTGTGKTAAFVLPMIERLASGQSKARMPRSLILSPTRELATQTADYFETYGRHLKLSMALLIGGVGMDEQWKKLERGVDVLIATPGRLLDQFERGKVLLGGVSILVIDEADRMLDMGFIPDVERIVTLISKRRQTLFFSATMPPEVRRLADSFLVDPVTLQASPPSTTGERILDHVTIVQPRQKFKVLKRLIETQDVEKAIIFCNRKRDVSVLRRQLERAGLSARDIHGDLDQSQRTQSLDAFKEGDVNFLVATDVAARGIDIAMLPCVINYDVPTHAEDYVHRIGRTGRAGQDGRAYTLAFGEEGKFIDAIAKLTGKKIPLLDMSEEGSAKAEGDAQAKSEKASKPARRGRRRAASDEETTSQGSDSTSGRRRRSAGKQEEDSDGKTARSVGQADNDNADTDRSGRPGRTRPEALPARGKAPRGRRREPEKPVIGMGDHVPLFMQRPVPVQRKASEG